MPFSFDQCFRGDSEGLVDRLIEASKLPEASSLVLRERELTRWMPDDEALPCAMAMMLDEPLEARHRASFKHSRSPDHKKSAGGAAAAHAKRARAPGSPPAAARRCSLDAAQGFACPSFNAAPKPEALPMPTTSLLTRALLNRRSPSPPKMAMAVAVAAA